MDFAQLIIQRQSDRRFTDQPVEKEKLEACLEAARLAPSAHNSQPWRFVIADEPELKAQVAEATVGLGMNKFVAQSHTIVAIVMEPTDFMTKLGGAIQDKQYSLIDVGITASHFCLQAAELGLGTCMLGWFKEKKVKELLGVPKARRVPLLIAVGYPAGNTRPKRRKGAEEIIRWNKY